VHERRIKQLEASLQEAKARAGVPLLSVFTPPSSPPGSLVSFCVAVSPILQLAYQAPTCASAPSSASQHLPLPPPPCHTPPRPCNLSV